MSTNKKILLGVTGIVVVLALIFWGVSLSYKKIPSGHVIKKDSKVTLKEALTGMQNLNFDDPRSIQSSFEDGQINSQTIYLLDHIMMKFKDSGNFDEHYEQVREYLLSILPTDEAEKMFALYKKYIDYQRSLEKDAPKWGNPNDSASAIRYLTNLQNYRRDIFGDDIADALFGADVQVKEYQVRRSSVVSDTTLYGAQKEELLKKLDIDMWGDQSNQANELLQPYDRYMDTLAMYQKDFSEISDEQRLAKIDEIRNKNFTPEQVARLKEVDRVIANDAKKEAEYRTKEQVINTDSSLSQDEKNTKIKELQITIFGAEEAEAFQRLQNIKEAEKSQP